MPKVAWSTSLSVANAESAENRAKARAISHGLDRTFVFLHAHQALRNSADNPCKAKGEEHEVVSRQIPVARCRKPKAKTDRQRQHEGQDLEREDD